MNNIFFVVLLSRYDKAIKKFGIFWKLRILKFV